MANDDDSLVTEERTESGLIVPIGASALAGGGSGVFIVPQGYAEREQQRVQLEWDRWCAKLRRYTADEPGRFAYLMGLAQSAKDPLAYVKTVCEKMDAGTFLLDEGRPPRTADELLAQSRRAGPNRADRRNIERKHGGFKKSRKRKR